MVLKIEVRVNRLATPKARKVAVLTTVIVIHGAMIAFLLQQVAEVPATVEPTSIAMMSLDAERPAAAKPPPPVLPSIVADTFEPLVEFSIPAETESNSPAGASGACATIDLVSETLLLNPAALDAIRKTPPETRSIADAIVIWNIGWAPAALSPVDPLFVVRTTIEEGLSKVDPGCLDEPVEGPRLLPFPDAAGTRTIFLAVGSGSWTWRALLTPRTSDDVTSGPIAVPTMR